MEMAAYIDKIIAGGAVAIAAVAGIWARMTFVRRSDIYRNGKPLFQYRDDCFKVHDRFNETYCHKFDEVKNLVKEADTKREEARIEIQKELRTISEFMGQVKQFMEQK